MWLKVLRQNITHLARRAKGEKKSAHAFFLLEDEATKATKKFAPKHFRK